MAATVVHRTEANLLYAFASETLASRRYLAFAVKAEEEDHQQVAVLFRYIAQRRSDHAQEHLRMLDALDAVCSYQSTSGTNDNLRTAIIDERHKYAASYPGMVRTARGEGFDDIADWFEMLAKVGRSHAERLQRALETLMQPGFSGFDT